MILADDTIANWNIPKINEGLVLCEGQWTLSVSMGNARDTEMTTRVTEDALTKSDEKETARSLAMQPLKTFKTFTLLSRAFRNLSSRTFLIKSSV